MFVLYVCAYLCHAPNSSSKTERKCQGKNAGSSIVSILGKKIHKDKVVALAK